MTEKGRQKTFETWLERPKDPEISKYKMKIRQSRHKGSRLPLTA